MFDNTNPYKLTVRYYASFSDSQGVEREVEISEDIYTAFQEFKKTERNLRRFDERHEDALIEFEEALLRNINPAGKSTEDTVCENERSELLRHAIDTLTDIQRRRFLLHYEFDLTYTQIAHVEGCTFQAVAKSIASAIIFLKKILKQG